MKFELPTFTTFFISDNAVINEPRHDQSVLSFRQSLKFLSLDGGKEYERLKTGNKLIYMPSYNSNGGCNLTVPGSDLKLYLGQYYAVPTDPGDEDWTYQDVQILTNTYRLRKKLTVAIEALSEYTAFSTTRAISILDVLSSTDQLKATDRSTLKLLNQFHDLMEITAKNY